jgi:hypothetical protein
MQRFAKHLRNSIIALFAVLLSANCAERYPSYVWYENPIEVHPIVDNRPFIIRLLDSLIVSISVLPFKGEIKGNADF